MRLRILLVSAVAALIAPATAAANFVHTVSRGETLTSVAAADGLSVAQLAGANGLSLDSQLVTGTALQIPPQGAAATPGATNAASPAAVTSGAYVVAPGDTLSAIAAARGTTVDALASANGLNPTAFLIAGSTITVPGASGPGAAGTQAPTGSGAQPTADTVSPGQIGAIAAANGVSPSLAEAIAYQESGFDNRMVSASGATGVMQIEPGTWSYINRDLSPVPPLSPLSPVDNIRGGVLLLRSLLAQTGGDPAQAAAGYYQGLASVQTKGMYADTQQYVNNVMALRAQFGGP